MGFGAHRKAVQALRVPEGNEDDPDENRNRSGRGGVRRRIADHHLELIAAAFARPVVADAVVVEILAPLRSEQRFAALRTGNDWTGLMERTSDLRSLLH